VTQKQISSFSRIYEMSIFYFNLCATEITSKYLKISIQGTIDNYLLKPELEIKQNKVLNIMMSNFQSRPTTIVLQVVSLQMSFPDKQPCKITK